MDIEEQKQRFLNLLRSSYKAALALHARPQLFGMPEHIPEKVSITTGTLKKYGFDDRDFWDIICPALEGEGYISDYDPYLMGEQDYYRRIPAYANLLTKERELEDLLPAGFMFAWVTASDVGKDSLLRIPYQGTDGRSARDIIADIQQVEKEQEEVRKNASENYPHVFTVIPERLLDTADTPAKKKRVNFDGKRTLSYKEARHVFHSGDGKHGQTLRFFNALWDNRQESAGTKETRKGVLKSEADYAHLLGLQDDRGLYRPGNDSYKTMQNLIKALNKHFRDKKIPANVRSAGGVLLEVKNPSEK